ncbi:MAG TPA: hypothetical protein DEB17_04940 [Chlorobaculum sp.]|jgi:hypothetical protein|uniref:Uncharacterized protein n=1 Tax=Chlorobaculum tepidum (strain ATCC 49652 / DSM 12025 / NBRC 103806 / TLS) TaxID=194439 RepID=Q8KAZ9_CHLTE|nr:hypothetical protein CT1999 [Chlorobaculum tepidum TLS]HBU23331.1 hypothetical protein [Chlorobaculum sp.]
MLCFDMSQDTAIPSHNRLGVLNVSLKGVAIVRVMMLAQRRISV